MVKREEQGRGILVLLLLALFVPSACTVKPEAEAETETSAVTATAAPAEPKAAVEKFGDAIRLPPIGTAGWTYLIAYQPNAIGYFEAYGDDLWILRADGYDIEVAEESERLQGGERKLAEFMSSRVLEERIFSRLAQGEREDRFLVLRAADGGIRVTGKEGQSQYLQTVEGGLRIERTGKRGVRVEEYRPDGSSRLSLDGKLYSEGGLREQDGGFEYFERPIEDQSGALDTFFTLEWIEGDRFRSEVGSVEPVAWVLVENLSSITEGERPLENLAVLDQIMGSERRITPLLALGYLGKMAAKGK